MKRFFLLIWDFIFCYLPTPIIRIKRDKPSPGEAFMYFRKCLLQDIEPIVNDNEMTDTQKIEKLKKMLENYDPLEY